MHVLIAITLIVVWTALAIYALWRVAQDLVIVRYAPGSPLADRDDYDLPSSAHQDPPVAQTAREESIDELHGDREQA
jgi:hypothetical protein